MYACVCTGVCDGVGGDAWSRCPYSSPAPSMFQEVVRLSSNILYITCKSIGRKGTIKDMDRRGGSDSTTILTNLVESQGRAGNIELLCSVSYLLRMKNNGLCQENNQLKTHPKQRVWCKRAAA